MPVDISTRTREPQRTLKRRRVSKRGPRRFNSCNDLHASCKDLKKKTYIAYIFNLLQGNTHAQDLSAEHSSRWDLLRQNVFFECQNKKGILQKCYYSLSIHSFHSIFCISGILKLHKGKPRRVPGHPDASQWAVITECSLQLPLGSTVAQVTHIDFTVGGPRRTSGR